MAIEDTNVNNQDHSNKVLNNRLDDFRIIFICQKISSISSPNTYRYIEKNHVYLKHAGILRNSNVLLMTIDNPRESCVTYVYLSHDSTGHARMRLIIRIFVSCFSQVTGSNIMLLSFATSGLSGNRFYLKSTVRCIVFISLSIFACD